MKKIIILLITICMLFCLSACEISELSSKSSSEFKTDTTTQKDDEITPTESENNHVSSNTEEAKENNTAQTQTQLNQTEPASTTNQYAHTHSYSNATCISPKKCSCGATEGVALGHQFSSATCTSSKTCSACGTTEGEKLAHNYKKGICCVCNAIDEQSYVNTQIIEADKIFIDYTKYNDALKIINIALQKCPNNSILKDKKTYYQSFVPVYLSDIEPYTKTTWFSLYDSDVDLFNTTHYHCVKVSKNFTTADGTYDLSAKYNTFNATIYGLGDGENGTLKIYADGVCIYSNTSIDPNTRPFTITLDVTGVIDLKFEMRQQYNSYVGECFGLSDIYVQKTIK